MRIIDPGNSGNDSSTKSRSRPPSPRASVTMVAVVAWVAFVWLALPVSSFGEAVVAAISPAIGFVAGAWTGFGLGFGMIGQVPSAAIILPALSIALVGAIAGCLSGWIAGSLTDPQDSTARSFISTLLSPEMWERNPPAFVCHLIVGTLIGIGVTIVLSSVGLFDATTTIGGSAQLVLGGGSGDPFGDNVISFLLALFKMLGALLVACALVGLSVGGVVGGAIGAGFSTVGVSAVIGGASEGLAFRFFAPFRPEDLRYGRFIYFLVGAGMGAAEGVLVGFGTGAALFLVRLPGVLS